jgi:integration host factor subunit beta
MIKSELIAKISANMTHLSEEKVAQGVNYMLALMADSLIRNQRIEIRGFGSFALRYRRPRKAHNPKTGARVETAAKYRPHFKPGKELREKINASRLHHESE